MRIRKKIWAGPELEACPYYIQNLEEWKGRWQEILPQGGTLALDLGCGKGVFLAEIAKRHPDCLFVGVDVSLDILGVARRNVAQAFGDEEPKNVRLICMRIEDFAKAFSSEDLVDRIYLNFSNPWPKARAHKKRLTHPDFLARYYEVMRPGGSVWMKTDSMDLYLASLRYFAQSRFEVTFQTEQLHEETGLENIFSEHEQMFTAQGIPIKAIIAKK